MKQEKASFSSPAFNEQQPLDKASGSMGITRSAKYTEVPRCFASSSTRDPSFT